MPKMPEGFKKKCHNLTMREQRAGTKANGFVGYRREVKPEHKEKLDIYLQKLLKQDEKNQKE